MRITILTYGLNNYNDKIEKLSERMKEQEINIVTSKQRIS